MKQAFLPFSDFSEEEPYNAAIIMAGRPPSKSAPSFGQRLAAVRKGKGISQEQFAKLLGATRTAVGYYERRAINPSIELIRRCADALGVSITEFVADETVAPRKRGPKSELEQRMEVVAKLPRGRQRKILEVVDALLKAG
jgi:transcriptional regulator with XRE-family HTH domain